MKTVFGIIASVGFLLFNPGDSLVNTATAQTEKPQQLKRGNELITEIPIPEGAILKDSTTIKNPVNKISPAELPPDEPRPGFELDKGDSVRRLPGTDDIKKPR